MSAFMCSDNHIGAVARAYCERFSDAAERFPGVYRTLARENARSVNARYSERNSGVSRKGKTITDYPELSPAALVKAVHCLDYQSCEHDGWARSKARRILHAICFDVSYTLVDGTPEFESAEWGIR